MKRIASTYVVSFVVGSQRQTEIVDCVGILAACREVRARFPNAQQLDVQKCSNTKSDTNSPTDSEGK